MRQTATPGHSGQIKLPAVTQFIKHADNELCIAPEVRQEQARGRTTGAWHINNHHRTLTQRLQQRQAQLQIGADAIAQQQRPTRSRPVASVGIEHEQFTVRLATGSIALQQAMNTIVADYHIWIVAVLNLVILCIFSLSHGSLITGLILLAPVNLAHQGMIAVMHLLGIGLDVNSMIMAANVLAALVVLPCLVALTHRRVYAALAQSSA